LNKMPSLLEHLEKNKNPSKRKLAAGFAFAGC
jgi:hypothetical protein